MCCSVVTGAGGASDEAPDLAEGVRQFFEVTVPGLLARNSEGARGIHGRCLFDVGDGTPSGGRWVVDFTADPPVVTSGDAAGTDCQMSLTAAELLELIEDPAAGQMLAWQGRLRAGGDRALIAQIARVLFPARQGVSGAMAGFYASVSRLIPDPRLTFMNYGFAQEGDDLAWCSAGDWQWRSSISLIRRTLAGATIEGARVLDIGCGRGGPAAYIAVNLEPLEVVGLDACADGIRFCERRHRHPNLRFVLGNAEDLPFEDVSFDVVLNVESSHCYLNLDQFLAEVARVLKPGGTFCYTDIFAPERFEQTVRLLAEAPGLHVADVADITPQVVRAIDLNRESIAELLVGAADGKLRNWSLIASLIRTVNVVTYEALLARRLRYHVFRAERSD